GSWDSSRDAGGIKSLRQWCLAAAELWAGLQALRVRLELWPGHIHHRRLWRQLSRQSHQPDPDAATAAWSGPGTDLVPAFRAADCAHGRVSADRASINWLLA